LVNVHSVAVAGGVHVTVTGVLVLLGTLVGLRTTATGGGVTVIEELPGDAPKLQLTVKVTPLSSSPGTVW